MNALADKMKTLQPDFKVFEVAESVIPNGYQSIMCHSIWDIKLGENFLRKAQNFAGVHTTTTP